MGCQRRGRHLYFIPTTAEEEWHNYARFTVDIQTRANNALPWQKTRASLITPFIAPRNLRGQTPPFATSLDLSLLATSFSRPGGEMRISVSMLADAAGFAGVRDYLSAPLRYFFAGESTLSAQVPATHPSRQFALRETATRYAGGERSFGFADLNGVGFNLNGIWYRQASIALSWQRRRNNTDAWEEFRTLTLHPGLEAEYFW